MTDKFGAGRLEGASAFCGLLTSGGELEREAEACRRCADLAFGRELGAKDVPAFGLANFKDCDAAAAAERGLTCVLLSSGRRTGEGMTAYTEPCFLPEEHPLASGARRVLVYAEGAGWLEAGDLPPEESLSGGAAPEGEDGCDNSIDVHPYYIRFSGDSGGWLDIVTRERMGEGVVTMPVSVKAMHNWASHAVRFDPEVFFARLIK